MLTCMSLHWTNWDPALLCPLDRLLTGRFTKMAARIG